MSKVWSIERDRRYTFAGYFVWSGTREEPLQRLHEGAVTLWGARWLRWRLMRKEADKTPQCWIVDQIETE